MTLYFARFKKAAEKSGLSAIDRGNYHWQVVGDALLVNFYPFTKKGMTYYVAGTTAGKRAYSIEDVLDAARSCPQRDQWQRKDKRKSNYKSAKRKLLAKSNKCHWCPKTLTLETATLDHRIPLNRGGLDNANNWVLACEECNNARGDSMPELSEAQG